MFSELKFNNIKDVCSKKVKPISNAAHVYLPKEWIDKKVIVLLVDDEEWPVEFIWLKTKTPINFISDNLLILKEDGKNI